MLVGTHDETGLGSNRHEELYVVLAGRALFDVDGAERELGPEEFLLVEPRRGAAPGRVADQTSVLVVGGTPGAVSPAPYEHWYTALTTDDPAESAALAAEGLAAFPRHGQLHYQLACFNALAGEAEAAAAHLRQAVTSDERAWEWLVDDPDLDVLRDLPGARADAAVRRGGARRAGGRRGSTSSSSTRGSPTGACGIRSGSSGRAGSASHGWTSAGSGARSDPKGAFSHGDDVLAALDALALERPFSSGRRSAAGSRSRWLSPAPTGSPGSCSPARGFPTTTGRPSSRSTTPPRRRRSRRATSTGPAT